MQSTQNAASRNEYKQPADMAEIRNLIVTHFDPSLPPEQRSMKKLGDALERMRTAVASNEVDWQDCLTQEKEGDADVALRANTAISLYNHFEWIFRTFEHMPGASVTVR